MLFDLGPSRITKEVLLNHNSEETYMAHYLGISPKDNELFISPLRKDRNPTVAFFRSRGSGMLKFKDFGDGTCEDFVGIVRLIFKCSYPKALEIIANDFGIIKKPELKANPPKAKAEGVVTTSEDSVTVLQCKVKDFTKEELEWWDKQGISHETLKHYQVYSVEHVYLNGFHHASSSRANPIYGYYFGKKNGVEQWKIYFPMRQKYRFLLNTNVVQGWKQLPEKGKMVVITKSMKEVMALYELGIPAIAEQTETVVMDNRRIVHLKGRFPLIITNGDPDRTGKLLMIKSRRAYRTICLTFNDRPKYGKDITEFIARYGRQNAIKLRDIVLDWIGKGKFDYHYKYYKESA